MNVQFFLIPITLLGLVISHASAQVFQSQDPLLNTPMSQPNTLSDGDRALQKITVTGSYIKRAISDTAPTPVIRLDSTKMEETGSYSVADMLQESAVFNDVEDGESISLHGQTEADNLVLLNGLRLPKTAGGSGVNIDFIPSAAVENVEVLKDGASALYGSEALAGVVNITTKKDFNGTNIYLRHATPQILKNQESDVVLSHGRSTNKWRYLVAGQFKNKTPMEYSDSIYGLSDLKQAGTLQSAPGNLSDEDDNFYRASDCSSSQIDNEGRCRTDRTRYDQFGSLGNERQSSNLFLNAGYDFSEKTKWDFVGLYTHRRTLSLQPPLEIQFYDETDTGGPDNTIPPAIADTWGTIDSVTDNPSDPFTSDVNLHYFPIEELGRLKSQKIANNIITQTRVSSQILSWDWELSAGYGRSVIKDTTLRGNANKQKLRDMIQDGRFKPFNPRGNKSDLSSTFVQSWFRHSSDILNTKFITTGELFKISQKPVLAAFGAEQQWQSFRFENDPLSLAGIPLSGQASNQNGSRRVDSLFVELNHNPIEQLELQLAGRFDNYTDVGTTLNPKIGLAYHFSPRVTSRFSYGTGFKAPDLLSVFKGTSSEFINFRDEVVCAQNGESDPNCDDGVYKVTEFGNRNLKPEQAQHYNVGLVLALSDRFTTTIDYWRVLGEEALSAIDLEEITKAEKLYGPSLLNDIRIEVQRDPTTKVIQSVRTPTRVNTGIFKIQGIDLSMEYSRPLQIYGLGGVSLKLQMDHTHIMNSGEQTFSFRPFEKDTYLDWKNVLSAIIARNNHLVRVAARSYSGRDKDETLAGIGAGTTPDFTEYDVHYQYFSKWDGTFSFGVKNLFNRKPIKNYRGFIEPANTNANPLGRTFYISYSQDI